MERPIDLAELVPCTEFASEDAEDETLIREMIERARSYLGSFDWCGQIIECYIGDIAVGGVVAVLLFKIIPARDGIDEWLWVVVGDLPPAYLVTDDAPKPAAALDAYIGEMERWVAAVRASEPVDDLIPVESAGGAAPLEPTVEHAHELERRLRFLNEKILADHGDDLHAT